MANKKAPSRKHLLSAFFIFVAFFFIQELSQSTLRRNQLSHKLKMASFKANWRISLNIVPL